MTLMSPSPWDGGATYEERRTARAARAAAGQLADPVTRAIRVPALAFNRGRAAAQGIPQRGDLARPRIPVRAVTPGGYGY